MQDFARQMRWLVDEAYPEVPVVRVVLDNLNTHRTASLYETFPAAEARRVAKRLEFHYTPKHGSWLNMAEIEFSVLSRPAPASSSASPTNPPSGGRSRLWSRSEMPPEPPLTGGSTPRTPGANFTASIPSIPNMTDY